MQFELDITKHLQSGSEQFSLHAELTTTSSRLALFGPSGSGKTLTLQAIAGLLTPDAGHIKINGKTLFDASKGINVPTKKRNVGYVFQNYALFPHLTVQENIGFGLTSVLNQINAASKQRVQELLEVFKLTSVATQMPATLSGGQQQRAALARALATAPDLLLLDEPFSALDQPLRRTMRDELTRSLEQFATPVVLVTHDVEEVEAFAETIAVYQEGQVKDVLETREVMASPHSLNSILYEQVAQAYR